jgi:hypothetical protein
MNDVLTWLRNIDPVDVLKWSTVVFLVALQAIAVVTLISWVWRHS